MKNWNITNLPPLNGKTVLITGTGGLALEEAISLTRAGAKVIIGGRNELKGNKALEYIRNSVPNAEISFYILDLANLKSIHMFATSLSTKIDRLDILINNAAVMAPPLRNITHDGFELQFGTNYLGHFALTAKLLPLLRNGHDARVVTISSIAAHAGNINFDDLNAEMMYRPMQSYGMSKLACLMFALELQHRSNAAGWGITSIAAHPGVTRTDLITNGAGSRSFAGWLRKYFWFLFQPINKGVLPIIYAAAEIEAQGGGYYGPDRLRETRGNPTSAKLPVRALDREVSSQLWTVSESLTKINFK
jgi:NAD(P)-dependent dehydrogenase (short-subunit alcohol dehydrogenase family)